MSVGKIGEFDVHSKDWKLYVERLEQYFVVNGVKTELQVPTLITIMGAESYELLVNLCTPGKPKNKTFEQISEIIEKHLQPKPSELAERYKFRQRSQTGSETISEYVAVLKRMSKTCEFGSWLEESLRDQLVCGISSETIRQRLFAESKLDFAKAYRLAVSMETAEKDAATVEGHSAKSSSAGTAECHMTAAPTWRRGKVAGERPARNASGAVRETGSRGAQGRRGGAAAAPAQRDWGDRAWRQQACCRACGGAHDTIACKFARYVCRACNKLGHLRRMCPNLMDQHRIGATGDVTSGSERESDGSEEFQIL
ncbi:uncharacterized protein LOC126381677 [Pectinophora gossypiella]|uniref:uncharacterized protein LOC126381677 n=1 Tax=Pectinophora gossypiella TaxID=13191 RepID=UPI00214E4743|nr:uncharacterized protein LOC126381677 [Pectinophora gossypiella]